MDISKVLSLYPRIGSDEVGKGDFFGPLVVAAVFLENPAQIASLDIRESKISSSQAIRRLAPLLMRTVRHSLVKILPPRYNELYQQFRNINSILGWAHARAIQNLLDSQLQPAGVVIDRFGPEFRVLKHFSGDRKKPPFFFFNRAEQDPVVAAASVIARFTFLKEMERLSQAAGLNLPLGAGEPVNRAALELADRLGKEKLALFAKVHFKNYRQLD